MNTIYISAKLFVLALIICLSSSMMAQPSKPYGILEGPPNTYNVVRLDPATGNTSPIVTIPGMQALVIPSTTTYLQATDQYMFKALAGGTPRVYVVDVNAGTIDTSYAQPENIVGMEYDCNTDSVYALFDNSPYELIQLNPRTGVYRTIVQIFTISAHSSSFTLNTNTGEYAFQGLNGNDFSIYSVNVHTGLINSTPNSNNLKGFEYDCVSDTIWALWEDPQAFPIEFHLVSVDNIAGTFTSKGIIAGCSGDVSETHAFNPTNGQYTFYGFTGPSLALYTVDVSTVNVTSSIAVNDDTPGLEEPPCCALPCPIPVPEFGWTSLGLDVQFTDSTVGGTAWHWDFGDGDSSNLQNPMHSFSADGSYWVCMTVSNNCGDSTFCDSISVIVTSLEEENLAAEQIEIFPNPARGSLRISLGKYSQDLNQNSPKALVFDLQGRQVMALDLKADGSYNISQLEPGVYHFEFHLGQERFSRKVLRLP